MDSLNLAHEWRYKALHEKFNKLWMWRPGCLSEIVRHQFADRLAIDDIPFVPHRHRQAAVAVPTLVLVVQFRNALPLDSPFIGLRSVVVVERGSGHPLDFQQDVKLVFRP